MKTHQTSYKIQFNPLAYLPYGEHDALRQQLFAQNVPIPMTLHVFRRKNHWALEVPYGIFTGNYRLDQGDLVDHEEGRNKLVESYLSELQAANDTRRVRRPWRESSDFLLIDNRPCYTLTALRLFAERSVASSFFTAAATFIKAANADFSLVRPRRRNFTEYTPPAARAAKFGKMVRGPEWTPEEDSVLRRWFGQRTIGTGQAKHQALTDEEWGYVLEALNGRRSQQSVRDRITALNKKLQNEMMIDGYLSRARLAEYMGRVLGERPRKPRMHATKPTRPRRRRHDIPASRGVEQTAPSNPVDDVTPPTTTDAHP